MISPNSQLKIKEEISFDSNSKISMSDLSFIDLGDSIIEGVCNSIIFICKETWIEWREKIDLWHELQMQWMGW